MPLDKDEGVNPSGIDALLCYFISGSFAPQAGAGVGSFAPQAGAGVGSFAPQAGAGVGSFDPQAGAGVGSAVPQAVLTAFSSNMVFPPFKDSIHILLRCRKESTGQI